MQYALTGDTLERNHTKRVSEFVQENDKYHLVNDVCIQIQFKNNSYHVCLYRAGGMGKKGDN
jgi:hypothetical protein